MGDFNFPGHTWSNGYGQVSTPIYGSSLNNLLLDTMTDAGLEQYVYQPTHQNNILDLVFSTHPRLSSLEIIPDVSDHDALIFNYEVTCKPSVGSNKHSVALYYKADLQSIKSDLATFCNNFLNSDPSSRSVDQLWEEFKEVVDKAVTNHVPHKVNRSHNRLPWINKPIKKDMKLRKCLYNKAKRTNLQNDWDAYHTLRNSINTKLKGAHNKY